MSDELTKLSGPELADRLERVIAAYRHVYRDAESPECALLTEACRRLREDTRVWQRRIERDRDEWRSAAERHAADLVETDARLSELQSERIDLRNERDQLRASLSSTRKVLLADVNKAHRENDELKAICDNQRKELHMFNVERAKTLTRLEDAQKRIAELEAQLRSMIGRVDGRDLLIKQRDARIEELEEALRELASYAGNGGHNAPDPIDVAQFVSKIRDGIDANAYTGAGVETRDLEQASVPPPRPVTDDEMRAATEEVRELHAKRESMVGPGQDALLSDAVISTANLSAFEVAAARAADALLVYADGMGFVKRAWLDRHRAIVAQQRKILDGPGPFASCLAEPADSQAPCDFKVGDRVTVDGQSGVVIEIDLPWIVVKPDAGMFGTWSSHVSQVRKAEPAERKPHEGRTTIEIAVDLLRCATSHDAASRLIGNIRADEIAHLARVAMEERDRLCELLDERKAIEALADELVREGDAMESASFNLTRGGYDQGVERGEAYGRRHAAQELREVLNGKR